MDFIEILEKTYNFVNYIKNILLKYSTPFRKKKTDETYEINFNFFSMNLEKKYVGIFFERDAEDIYVWAGYDIAIKHFCISFCSSQHEILKQVLETSLFSYSAEYCAFDKGYWYSIYVDAPYKNNDEKDRESKFSTNEIDYSSLENDIAAILSNFDTEIKKKQGTENA